MMHFKAVTRHDRWRNLEPITDPDGNVFEDWAALFEAMPERFLVGSDAKFGRRRYDARRYQRDVDLLRGVLGTLNARAARLIAHDNAAALYGGGGASTGSEGKGVGRRYATIRRDELLGSVDMDGATIWKRIIKAVDALQSKMRISPDGVSGRS